MHMNFKRGRDLCHLLSVRSIAVNCNWRCLVNLDEPCILKEAWTRTLDPASTLWSSHRWTWRSRSSCWRMALGCWIYWMRSYSLILWFLIRRWWACFVELGTDRICWVLTSCSFSLKTSTEVVLLTEDRWHFKRYPDSPSLAGSCYYTFYYYNLPNDLNYFRNTVVKLRLMNN